MTHKIFRLFTSLILALAFSVSGFAPALAAPPANDNFADAEVISSLPFSVSVDNTEATFEVNEPPGCSTFVFRSVWYSFTPAATMAIRMDMAGSQAGGHISLFRASGPGFSNLMFLDCIFSGGSAKNFQLEAGQTYYIQVDSLGQPGIFQLNLQQIFPPANDNFANAEAITSLPFSATVDNTDATTELGESVGCGSSNGTLWYSFTPTQNTAVRVDMTGSAVSGSVNVYLSSGAGIANLTFLTCISSSSSANLNFESGKTYYLQVTDFGRTGILQINLQKINAPANDNFANAEAITSLPFSAVVDNTDATTELGEPRACDFPFRSVWYSFTPTENMAIRVERVGSAVDGSVSIFLASGPAFSDLALVGCVFGNSSSNFQVEAGKTYYLQVDSFIQTGSLQINLQQITPPVNDNFANAEAIASLPFSATVDNTNASAELGEPQGCSSPLRSLWYSFTPTENIAVRIDTVGSATSSTVNLYVASGPSISDLTLLTCASNNSSSNFQVAAGKTYYLQVDMGGQAGSLQVNLQQITAPANDNFANAETITSLPFSATADNTNASFEPGEPLNCGPLFRSVWYSFTPTENMAIGVGMVGNAIGGSVSIYLASGSTISNLTFVGCMFSGSTSNFNVEAGNTYYLRVDSFGQAGSLQINLQRVLPSVVEVKIDIKPGSSSNPINPKSTGTTPVAILSTKNFNALRKIDKTSLTFGRTGNEVSLAFCDKKGKDVNGDGLLDLVCHFKTKLTGFQIRDIQGILKGRTVDGISIQGHDSIKIVPPTSYP